ncbi:MAG: hypothetical protein FGM54_00295 [Chitinophagaceae bacterium]|nr:hypothetical protein [Chitinophagaceae bacterium]
MLRKTSLCLALLVSTQLLNAQSKVKVSEFSVSTGSFMQESPISQFADWQRMAPGSSLLPTLSKDLNSFDQMNSEINGGNVWSANLGLQFTDRAGMRYNRNPLLRLGIQYQGASVLSQSFHKQTIYAHDTLTSSQTGEQTYVDSIQVEHYDINYRQKRLMLDASLIFRTKSQSRWGLYAGIGMSLGASFRNQTELNYSMYKGTSGIVPMHDMVFHNMFGNNNDNRHEHFANKASFAGALYIPLGATFRLSNKHEFWNKISLTFETRPGLYWSGIPELTTTTLNTGVATQVGFRVNW